MNYASEVMQAIAAERSKFHAIDAGDHATFIANLVFVQQVITASEGLLEEAIKASDGELRRYFELHLEEEHDHADWLAADLQTAGVGPAEIIPAAMEMAGAQYYMIKHVSPLCLLGYMAVLEGSPTPLVTVEALESTHGTDLIRTLRYHATHDIDHSQKLLEIINRYKSPYIMQSAMHAVNCLHGMTKSLADGSLQALIREQK